MRGLYNILDRKSNSSLDLPCAFALTSSLYPFFYAYVVVPVCLITRYTSTSCSGVHSSLAYRAGCRARPLGLYKKSPEKEKSRVGESDERINLVVSGRRGNRHPSSWLATPISGSVTTDDGPSTILLCCTHPKRRASRATSD